MCGGGELLQLVHGGFVMSTPAQGGSWRPVQAVFRPEGTATAFVRERRLLSGTWIRRLWGRPSGDGGG